MTAREHLIFFATINNERLLAAAGDAAAAAVGRALTVTNQPSRIYLSM